MLERKAGCSSGSDTQTHAGWPSASAPRSRSPVLNVLRPGVNFRF